MSEELSIVRYRNRILGCYRSYDQALNVAHVWADKSAIQSLLEGKGIPQYPNLVEIAILKTEKDYFDIESQSTDRYIDQGRCSPCFGSCLVDTEWTELSWNAFQNSKDDTMADKTKFFQQMGQIIKGIDDNHKRSLQNVADTWSDQYKLYLDGTDCPPELEATVKDLRLAVDGLLSVKYGKDFKTKVAPFEYQIKICASKLKQWMKEQIL